MMTHPLSPAGTEDLWRAYLDARAEGATAPGRDALRDELVLRYAGLVDRAAGRLAVRIPSGFERADLRQWGVLGLIDAVERYEPRPGSSFEAYALIRIQGAIRDEIRAIDFLPRTARDRARDIETRVAALAQRIGRTPTEQEAAAACELTLDDYRRRCDELSASICSLDALLAGANEDRQVSLLDALTSPDDASTPERVAVRLDLARDIAEVVARLPEREQLMLGLYYVEDLTQAEIAAVLGVTESRVSQIHGHALGLLRALLAARAEVTPVEASAAI